jgi:hypothetical protein
LRTKRDGKGYAGNSRKPPERSASTRAHCRILERWINRLGRVRKSAHYTIDHFSYLLATLPGHGRPGTFRLQLTCLFAILPWLRGDTEPAKKFHVY